MVYQPLEEKRLKVEEIFDNTEDKNLDPSTTKWTKDPDYYHPDGDIVVLSENKLFKVHRFLLTRDSQLFAVMLASSTMTSFTDHRPLALGDSEEDFRALCWILYALPDELFCQADHAYQTTAKSRRLMSVFDITNKYQMKSFRQWSGEQLAKHCRNAELLSTCTVGDLKRLIITANTCRMHDLANSVASIWISRMDIVSLKCALTIAESLYSRWFEGRVYYFALLHGLRHNIGQTST
ncbi:hypothetical protein CPB83DRAFT_859371 [Crepidotus variabilis]|uniref:BTB domain-containing protein n=1 Tax=Crepidotus variabilis TaxID=179855 RepID=A0A9P6EAM0_9AGAR|nr:hypothetical protein CPB83DRAFT_859371 [Crepidotus variabilis]